MAHDPALPGYIALAAVAAREGFKLIRRWQRGHQSELAWLRARIDALEAKVETLEAQKLRQGGEIQSLREDVAEAVAERDRLRTEKDALQNEIRNLEAQNSRQAGEIRELTARLEAMDRKIRDLESGRRPVT